MQKENVIFDLDGTLADLTHRLHHIKEKPKNWELFHTSCVDDKPKQDVIDMARALYHQNYQIWVLSGRNNTVWWETVAWLGQNGVLFHQLVMREAKDRRDDTIVKLEMTQKHGLIPQNTLCIFDDRQKVVNMWRQNGFTCMQVDAWEE